MLCRVALVALLALACASCGKKSDPTPSLPEPAPETTTAPEPETKPSSPNQTARDESRLNQTLQDLTQAARKYGLEQRRVPKSLDELVSAGYLSHVPTAPTGKRFAINKNLEVYLADP